MTSLIQPLRRSGFRTKVSVSIISLLLVFGIGLSLIISRIVSQAMVAENKARGVSQALNLAARATEPLIALDLLHLKNLADEAVRTSEGVSYAFIADHGNQPLSHTFIGGFPVDLRDANPLSEGEPYRIRLLSTGIGLIYDVAAPVTVAGDRIGTVRLGLSRTHVDAVVNRLLFALFLTTGIGIVIAAVVATALSRTVTRRIQNLHRSAEEIIKGNLDVQSAATPSKHCWEVMQCDKTGCPAYGDKRQRCWYLVGTLCPTCVSGKYETKIESCRDCPLFKEYGGDEIQHLAEFFDIMAVTLKDRLEALKRSEENLRRQQQVFQTILDVTPDLVCLKSRSGRYQAVNKAFCAFVGKSENDILGRCDREVLPQDLADASAQEDITVQHTGQTIMSEKRIPAGSGSRWLHVVKTPVVDPDGEVEGVLCTSRDITEMKDLHEKIVRSQRLESLGQLAAGVAHEINTPLGIILGNAQLMIEEVPAGSDMEEGLKTIEKYARVSKSIVADLLRFARHTESVKRPLNINEVLSEVLSIVEHTFGLDRITIIRRFSPDLPLVFGDQEKLEQVFMNLLNNARDAIGSDGTVRVSTNYDGQEHQVVVSIADTGKGIPPDIRERIFDPFFTTKGVGSGTGLGLSVTFGIIKDHGGRIEVISPCTAAERGGGEMDVRGRGAEFIVSLPEFLSETAQSEA
jgi:PAS domain S-box-containing protein